MEIVSVILEIRFINKISLIEVKDNRKSFVEAISGEVVQPPPDKIFQGLQQKHIPTKTFTVLEPNRFAISVELDQKGPAQERVIQVLKEVYKKFEYKNNEIARVGVKTTWIDGWEGNFTSLVKKYKEKFYMENSIIAESVDVGINFTLTDDPYKINFISGPMKPDQALSMLKFKDRTLPHDFIYIDVDRFDANKIVRNSFTSIKNFLKSSINYGEQKAQETLEILKNTL